MTTNIQKWQVTIAGTYRHIIRKKCYQSFDSWSEAAHLFRIKCDELDIDEVSELAEGEEYTTSMNGQDYVLALEKAEKI